MHIFCITIGILDKIIPKLVSSCSFFKLVLDKIFLDRIVDHNQHYYNDFTKSYTFMLDVARRKMTKNQIIESINAINPRCFNSVMLHLSDNEAYSVSIISDMLGVKNGILSNGWLSESDLNDIVKAAKDKSLYLIPDIDAPSHVKSWYDSLSASSMSIDNFSDSKTYEIDLLSQSDNIYEMYKKCMKIFAPVSKFIMIGVDEVPGNIWYADKLAIHINKLNNIAKELNYKIIVWNDALNPKLLPQIQEDVTIVYWQDSDVNNLTQLLERKNPIKNAYYETNYDNVHDLNKTEYQEKKIQMFVDNLISNNMLCLWGEDSEDIPHSSIIDFINKLQDKMPKTQVTPTISNSKQNNVAAAVAVPIVIIIVACVAIGIFIWYRKNKQNKSNDDKNNDVVIV